MAPVPSVRRRSSHARAIAIGYLRDAREEHRRQHGVEQAAKNAAGGQAEIEVGEVLRTRSIVGELTVQRQRERQ